MTEKMKSLVIGFLRKPISKDSTTTAVGSSKKDETRFVVGDIGESLAPKKH